DESQPAEVRAGPASRRRPGRARSRASTWSARRPAKAGPRVRTGPWRVPPLEQLGQTPVADGCPKRWLGASWSPGAGGASISGILEGWAELVGHLGRDGRGDEDHRPEGRRRPAGREQILDHGPNPSLVAV